MYGTWFDSLEAVLRRGRLFAAGVVAELHLLRQVEELPVPARRAARAQGHLVELEVEEIAALVVEVLRRLLRVGEEAGEVFEEAHLPVDDEELLRVVEGADAFLVGDGQRVARGGVARLVRVLGAVEALATGDVVVLPHDPGGVVHRVVRRGGEAEGATGEAGLVLADGRAALRLPVHAIAVAGGVLGAAEGAAAGAFRTPGHQQALAVVAAGGELGGEPALGETKMVVGAAGDGEVALLRRVRSLGDPETFDQLGDDEVRVGVAVAVEVAGVVEGNAVDGELEVLAFARVEATEEDLLGVAGAALVGEEDARGELEEVGSVAARDGGERAHVDGVIGGAVLARLVATAHDDVLGRGSARRRRRTDRAGGGGRGRVGGGARRELVGLARLHHLGRRRGRGEVERDADAAGERFAGAHGRTEGPLAHGDHRGLVQIAAARLGDVHLGDVPVGIHRHPHDHVGVAACGQGRRRVFRVDVGDDLRRRDPAGQRGRRRVRVRVRGRCAGGGGRVAGRSLRRGVAGHAERQRERHHQRGERSHRQPRANHRLAPTTTRTACGPPAASARRRTGLPAATFCRAARTERTDGRAGEHPRTAS